MHFAPFYQIKNELLSTKINKSLLDEYF